MADDQDKAGGSALDEYPCLPEPISNEGVNMTDEKALEILRQIFSGNHFTQYVGIIIDEVSYGKSKLRLPINGDIHANLTGHVHGGALYTLANTAAGVAAMSTGRFIVTQSMTVNYIRNIVPGDTATCHCRVTHAGRRMVDLIADIYDGEGRLMVNAVIAMFVTGYSSLIPAQW